MRLSECVIEVFGNMFNRSSHGLNGTVMQGAEDEGTKRRNEEKIVSRRKVTKMKGTVSRVRTRKELGDDNR
jgi:hypothetical protein